MIHSLNYYLENWKIIKLRGKFLYVKFLFVNSLYKDFIFLFNVLITRYYIILKLNLLKVNKF